MSDASGMEHAVSTAGLGRKVGPLPVWGWAVLIVGGAAVLYFFFIKPRNTAAPIADNNGAGLASLPPASSGSGGGSGSGSMSGFSNNRDWIQAAIGETGSSQYTPLQVQQAVGNLQSGTALDATQQKIINWLESSLGAPPESVPTPVLAAPVTTVTPPVTTPTKTAGHGNTNPWGSGAVFAIGSSAGAQYIAGPGGKPVQLSKAQVSAARANGYNYQTVVVPSIRSI